MQRLAENLHRGAMSAKRGRMSKRYEVVRSVKDENVHVLLNEGAFAALPDRIRYLGPWQRVTGDDIEALKAHYRMQLAERGFLLLYKHRASFTTER
jgi:hypothetical protein